MSENRNNNALPPSAATEEELRTAMAINRLMQLSETLRIEANKKTRGHYAALKVGYLEGLFHRIHREAFQDWKGAEAETTDDEKKAQAKKRIELREVIQNTLFSKEKDGTPTGLFDANGCVVREKEGEKGRQRLADILTNFYEQARDIEPYEYGNKITLDFFISSLNELPAFAEVYPEKIDFRRLDKQTLKKLEKKEDGSRTNHEEIKAAFMMATDPSIIHPLMNVPKPANEEDYTVWDDKTIYIGGVPFLSHEHNGQLCLVTINGGLAPLAVKGEDGQTLRERLEKFFENDGLIANFRGITKNDIIDYLPEKNREEDTPPLKNKTSIDGIQITDDNQPLLCLDVNTITGLRQSSHDEFVSFMKKVLGEKAKLTDLNNKNPDQISEKKAALLAAANGDQRMKEIIEIAYNHININVKRMDGILDTMFEGKKASKNPKMYMSMGGSGSGKSSVEKVVDQQCREAREDYIIASLDEFRNFSDLHRVLIAAEHHADDYALIDPFATELRKQATARAKELKINVLIDGSGIDYKGRNDEITKEFKDAEYQTQVIAVETYYPNAVSRVNQRFREQERAMPWVRVADKHMSFPISFLDAVQDKNLDKVSLICSDDFNNNYIIAETFYKDTDGIIKLKDGRKTGLLATITGFLEDSASILNPLKAFEKAKKDEAAANNAEYDNKHNFANVIPNFEDENVSYIKYPSIKNDNKAKRVLAIYDAPRMVGFMEKGMMNPNTSSLDTSTLYHAPNNMQFSMPAAEAVNDGAWQLKLRHQSQSSQQRQ